MNRAILGCALLAALVCRAEPKRDTLSFRVGGTAIVTFGDNGKVTVAPGATAQQVAEAWARQMASYERERATQDARLDECEKWLRRTEPKLLDDRYEASLWRR